MNSELFRFICLVFGFLFFAILETYFPKRQWKESRIHRYLFHVSLALLNSLIGRFLVTLPLLFWASIVHEKGFGLLEWFPSNSWIHPFLLIVILDGFNYFWHRMNHSLPLFWRFHKVHHVDTHLDVTTGIRFHIGEIILSVPIKGIWIFILSPSPSAYLLFEGISTFCAEFHHCNIDLGDFWDNLVRKLFVTPRFHTAHHSVHELNRNANYSVIFSFWDRLFRSNVHPKPTEDESVGLLSGREKHLSFPSTFLAPIRNEY